MYICPVWKRDLYIFCVFQELKEKVEKLMKDNAK